MADEEKLLLEVQDLSVSYGAVLALKGVSFEVKAGEIVAMIGPNGAGKSTALKAVAGALEADDGKIENGRIMFEGKDIKGKKPHELVRERICLVPERRRVFTTMTVVENLQMGAYLRNDKKGVQSDLDRMLNLFPVLKARTAQKAGTLSAGEQQMLAIGRALMLKPKLLLADEPSLGLSPNYIKLVFNKLIEINEEGTSILLVEQNASEALRTAHRAYVFSTGEIALSDTSKNLLLDEKVKKSFLGG